MWQRNERLPDEISIKVDVTAKFTGSLYCIRIDETNKDMGRKRQRQRARERWRVERIQTDGDRESWPALGVIKLPLLALIQREEEWY